MITGALFVVVPVVKLQVGPVTVSVPSETVAYHSYSVLFARPGQEMEALPPLVDVVHRADQRVGRGRAAGQIVDHLHLFVIGGVGERAAWCRANRW